jgi:hypothetical protein
LFNVSGYQNQPEDENIPKVMILIVADGEIVL